MTERIRLVVLFGGRSAEHEVSCTTAVNVLQALDPARYDVVPVGVTHEGRWVLAEEAAKLLAAGGPAALPPSLAAEGPTVEPLATVGEEAACRLDGAAFAGCTTPMSYSGLGNGTHTFDVRATDPAGNVDTSPASYTWRIDNVAPSTPTLTAPADGLVTNSLPQLRALFNDASVGGDTGTIDFQLCSAAAPAGTSCAPVVQSATSGSVSNGGTASFTPGPLSDGTYYWQARAQDAAGNQSSWSATRSPSA